MSTPREAAGHQSERPAPDVRLEGGTILPLGDAAEFAEAGFVDIVGDRVAAVGPLEERPATSPRRVIDTTGSIVLPGLVDAHTHLFQVAARGLGDGLGLAEWLRTHMIPLALELRRDEMVALSELGALHSLRRAPSPPSTITTAAGANPRMSWRWRTPWNASDWRARSHG